MTVPATTNTATSATVAAPTISSIAVNSNDSMTLKGTAVDDSTVTVWSTAGTDVGTTTASSTGAWSFTTPVLLPGVMDLPPPTRRRRGRAQNRAPLARRCQPQRHAVTSNSLVAAPATSAAVQSFSANGNTYGDETNLTATSDELDLAAGGLTVTRGSGTESLEAGSVTFPFSSSDYRSTETIEAQPGDHFVFNPNFGNETIQGFAASDTVQLAVSSFSYLNAGMSQAADLAAVLLHSTSGTSGTTITNSLGDTLTLAGLSSSAISADAASNHSLFKFV